MMDKRLKGQVFHLLILEMTHWHFYLWSIGWNQSHGSDNLQGMRKHTVLYAQEVGRTGHG